MEILFWFILALTGIVCIARYNEEDKLFWKLLISLIGTFAAAVAVIKFVQSSEKKDKIECVSANPMQVLASGSHIYCVLADSSDLAIQVEKSTKPASKEFLANYNDPILSKVAGGARDQPFEFFNTS